MIFALVCIPFSFDKPTGFLESRSLSLQCPSCLGLQKRYFLAENALLAPPKWFLIYHLLYVVLYVVLYVAMEQLFLVGQSNFFG